MPCGGARSWGMSNRRRMLLGVDASINLVLGLALQAVPRPAIAVLGLSVAGSLFM